MDGASDPIRVLYLGLADDGSTETVLDSLDSRFEVLETDSEEGLLDALQGERPDAIVLADDSPNGSGDDVLAQIRSRDPEIPVYLLSSTGAALEDVNTGAHTTVIADGAGSLETELESAGGGRPLSAAHREVLGETADAIMFHDPETGAVQWVNDAFADLLGYDRATLTQMSVGDFSADAPGYTGERARELVNLASTEGPQTFEWYAERADGTLLPVEVRLSHTSLGERGLVIASVRDISERTDTRRRLEGIVENAEQAIYVKDQDGVYELVNPAAAEALGTTRERLLGSTDADVMTEADATRIREIEEEVMESGEPVTYERRIQAGDGERFYRNQKFPLKDITGTVRGLVGISTDVTERRRRAERMQSQRDRLQALHEVATDLEQLETEAAVYERIVEAAESVLEFDLAIIDRAEGDTLVPIATSSGLSSDRYYAETSIDATDNVAARVFREGESSIIEDIESDPASPASGEVRSALTVPIGDHGVFQTVDANPGAFDETDLELVELLAAHADNRLTRLADRRELTARTRELERQNERLEEFASVVSHDLRNPLNVVRGRLELLRERSGDVDLDDAAAALDRMEALVDDLLMLARQGPELEDVEPVDLAAECEGCWATVATAEAELVVEVDRQIEAVPGRFRQLLENLIANAIEHGGPDVTVTIGQTAEGFYIADDGPGIPPDRREAIFEPGYSTGGQVTGLGLNIVMEVAEAHGWELDVRESEDGGAKFAFSNVTFV